MRPGQSIQARRATARTIVTALRSVFTASYPEEQFRNLFISTDYPMSRQQYPAIYVDLKINRVRNAGIGHKEYFREPGGTLREWKHYMFDGSITLNVLALSSVDRDELIDTITELISMGRLYGYMLPFFDRIWGDPTAPYSQATARYQLEIQTDEMTFSQGSPSPVPWGSEDELAYGASVSFDMFGGFYNALDDTIKVPVSRIDMYPYITNSDKPEWVGWVSDKQFYASDTVSIIPEVDGVTDP